MQKELAERLEHILFNGGYEVNLRDDYSGRCMYGKETHAISGDFSISELLSLVLEAVKHGTLTEDDLSDIKRFGLSQDSMGLGVVIY